MNVKLRGGLCILLRCRGSGGSLLAFWFSVWFSFVFTFFAIFLWIFAFHLLQLTKFKYVTEDIVICTTLHGKSYLITR